LSDLRLPAGDLPVSAGDGTSKSAASRRFVAMVFSINAQDSDQHRIIADVQPVDRDDQEVQLGQVRRHPLRQPHKHPLALIEGATKNAAVVQALIDNLIERGLDPKVCRLFVLDCAKALSKVIRRTFGAHTPIQRCQIHKARNVIKRLPKPLHASGRRVLRQAWELYDADQAERLLRNLAPSA
jgi:putative transposase